MPDDDTDRQPVVELTPEEIETAVQQVAETETTSKLGVLDALDELAAEPPQYVTPDGENAVDVVRRRAGDRDE